MSMTDYAQLVDESGDPNLHLEMKMPKGLDPEGLIDHTKKKDGKAVRPLKGIRNSRLDEIHGSKAHGAKGTKHSATHTLQPLKGFNLGSALELEKKKEEEEQKQ